MPENAHKLCTSFSTSLLKKYVANSCLESAQIVTAHLFELQENLMKLILYHYRKLFIFEDLPRVDKVQAINSRFKAH